MCRRNADTRSFTARRLCMTPLIANAICLFMVYVVSLVIMPVLCKAAEWSFKFWTNGKEAAFSAEARWWHNLVLFGPLPLWAGILTIVWIVTLCCYILSSLKELSALAITITTIAICSCLLSTGALAWIAVVAWVISRWGIGKCLQPQAA